VQGELWLIEMVLYNSKTSKQIDKLLLSKYSLSAERTSESDDDAPADFSPSEIKKGLSIKKETGLFKITSQGFKPVPAKKN